MRRTRLTISIFFSALFTISGVLALRADAAAPAMELAAFLEEPGDEAEISAAAKSDPRAPYTLALAAIKKRKYDAALEHLNMATTRNRGDLVSWRAKFWLLTYTKQREAALGQMKHVADLYPASAANESVGERLKLTAYWMGKLCTYIVGPAEDVELAPLVSQIEGQLQGDFLAEFQKGKTEVTEVFTKMAEDIVAAREDDETTAESREQDEEEFLAKERERIASEREEIAQTVANTRAEIEKAIADVDARLRPLELRLRDLNLLAEPIRQRIRDAQLQYSSVSARTGLVRDRVIQSALQGEASAQLIILRREQDRLRPYEFEAARVQQEAARLLVQRNQLAGQFQGQVNQAGARQTDLARTEKKLNRAENGPERTYTPISTRTRGLQAKASSLTTYLPFPLEVERTRILDALRK